jgi:hypothetical protein
VREQSFGPGDARRWTLQNVLTAKKRRFWGVLAEKSGFGPKKNELCGRAFSLFRGSLAHKPLILSNLHESEPLQTKMPENLR